VQIGLTSELRHSASAALRFFTMEFDERFRISGHLIQTLCYHERRGGGLDSVGNLHLIRHFET
jgi:hypothetical protein